jgi:hypothetical protein
VDSLFALLILGGGGIFAGFLTFSSRVKLPVRVFGGIIVVLSPIGLVQAASSHDAVQTQLLIAGMIGMAIGTIIAIVMNRKRKAAKHKPPQQR